MIRNYGKYYLFGLTALAALIHTTTAQAALVVVDTFDNNAGQINVSGGAAGGDQWLNGHTGPGITGYGRQVHARDGHSGTLGNPTAMTVAGSPSSFPPTPASVIEWWGGSTAPDHYVQYGTAINAGAGGDNTPMNIHGMTLTDNFMMVVVNQPSDTNMGNFSITLYTGTDGGGGGGNYTYNSSGQVPVGTFSIPLSAFVGLTAQNAADIDGLKIQTAASYWDGSAHGSAQGAGVQVGEVSIGTAAEPVPEPSTYALGLIGLAGLGLIAWRKRRAG